MPTAPGTPEVAHEQPVEAVPDGGAREAAPGLPARPVGDGERLGGLDTLRGVAVLGILAMNIRNFALPISEFDQPRLPRGAAGEAGSTLAPEDFWTWLVSNVLCEDKMITIFGLLFGAGVVVFGDRLDRAAREGSGRGGWRSTILHYRRMLWLLVIGLLHAYLLWYGDILNTYAMCGMLIWPLRRLRPGVLIGVGVVALLVTVWVRVGPPLLDMVLRDPGTRATPGPPGLGRRVLAEALRTEEAAYRGGWLDLFWWRANLNTFWHFTAGITFSLWRSVGHMLIGMGLMRLGMFAGAWRASAYAGLALGAYGLGLSLTLMGMSGDVAEVLGRGPEVSGGAARLLSRLGWSMRFLGALGMGLGHAAVVLMVFRWRWLGALRAVGRMALTNYLMHTVICVLVFDGWAGGQWDRWAMHEMSMLVAGIWALQLIASPLWLRWYRLGPMEWAWRSLTYWRVQPMRRAG